MTTSDGAMGAVPYRHMLLLRFVLLNIVAVELLALAWANGLVQWALAADDTRFVLLVVLVAVAGLLLSARHVVETSRELERLRQGRPGRLAAPYLDGIAGKDSQSRQILATSLRLELSQRITLVRHLGNSLVFLGLIGTVIGFIIALSGVDPETVDDAEQIAPMVSALIRGMSTALVTTLVGAVLNIWVMANYQILATGTARLINAVVALGEDRARA